MDAELASTTQECCLPVESVPCQPHQDSGCLESEQCRKCSTFFPQVLLFCEQHVYGFYIQETGSLMWLSEKEPSLVHSPEAPPPKV